VIDALGSPQSILVLGGTSDIAGATVRRLAASGRLDRVVLAARPGPRRVQAADAVRALGVPDVRELDLEATDPTSHDRLMTEAFDSGDIDVVLLAVGVLPDQPTALGDPALAVDTFAVNATGAASLLLRSTARLRAQGHGRVVVLSSVAAERPRQSNFVYGASKAAIDALATGLSDGLHGSGVGVLVVRPGFVHTAMTRGLRPAPFAVGAEAVADAIADHLRDPSGTIWVPGKLRLVMTVVRHLPRTVFRRLPI
jgi:decaprenylphospho-beta-D-erythro-pentofuranosid-2-ulose 2-reductase